jgi:hypothetical protein
MIRKFENFEVFGDDKKSYSKEEVISLIQDYYMHSLGEFDPVNDEERNFTDPNSRNYINVDLIKSKIEDFMKDK